VCWESWAAVARGRGTCVGASTELTHSHTDGSGQTVARVFPSTPSDRRMASLFLAGITSDLYIQPGKPASQGSLYLRPDGAGGKLVVTLGAGKRGAAAQARERETEECWVSRYSRPRILYVSTKAWWHEAQTPSCLLCMSSTGNHGFLGIKDILVGMCVHLCFMDARSVAVCCCSWLHARLHCS
jgi:hypothetical protein